MSDSDVSAMDEYMAQPMSDTDAEWLHIHTQISLTVNALQEMLDDDIRQYAAYSLNEPLRLLLEAKACMIAADIFKNREKQLPATSFCAECGAPNARS